MAAILFKLLTASVFLVMARAEKQWCKLNSKNIQNECNRCWCIGHGVPVCTKMDCKRIPPEHWKDVLARSKQFNNGKDNSKKDNETIDVTRKIGTKQERNLLFNFGPSSLSAWGGRNVFSSVMCYLTKMFSGNTGLNPYYNYGSPGYNPNGFGYPGYQGNPGYPGYGANGYGYYSLG